MANPNEPAGGAADLRSADVPDQAEPDPAAAPVAQSEPDASAAPVTKQAEPGAGSKPEGQKEKQGKNGVQPYDFRHPAFLSAGELRRLRFRHEDFIRALGARLSIYMRMEFSLKLSEFKTITYQKFVEALPNPTHLSLFRVEPLRGICILDIRKQLGFTIVDRLLGGAGQEVVTEREFSEIEIALLDQAVQLILAEWCAPWKSVQELRPVLLGHENNAKFLQTAPHDTILLVIAMEAKLGECVEQIQMALPCSTLEPLILKLGNITEKIQPNSVPARVPKWNRNFDEVPVPITAVLDNLILSAREVANLKPGDVLPLDPRSIRQVKLRLANMPKFEGNLGTTGGKWAVAVTSVAKPALGN